MGTVSAGRAEGAERNFPFTPDYAIPPGETLEETLEVIGMSQSEFAKRTGRPEKTINEIIKGKAAITPETALQFERVTGIPARTWLNLETNYRSQLVRQNERGQLREQVGWLKDFPYRALVKRGYLVERAELVGQLEAALDFYGVASLGAYDKIWRDANVAYHHSAAFDSDQKALTAWLRCGEIEAQKVECAPYDKAAFLEALQTIRGWTTSSIEDVWDDMVALCAKAGVALVFTQELPGTHVSGATRWLGPHKAILQMSLRYRSDDQIWFAFFHEAAHLILHGKRERFVSADPAGSREKDPAEAEASAWAASFLIPPQALEAFVARRKLDLLSIQAFAAAQGIAAGIVVGQLEHRGIIPYGRGAKLKKTYEWDFAEE